jgi:hypothetical protein
MTPLQPKLCAEILHSLERSVGLARNGSARIARRFSGAPTHIYGAQGLKNDLEWGLKAAFGSMKEA